jgi:hypothetical protein
LYEDELNERPRRLEITVILTKVHTTSSGFETTEDTALSLVNDTISSTLPSDAIASGENVVVESTELSLDSEDATEDNSDDSSSMIIVIIIVAVVGVLFIVGLAVFYIKHKSRQKNIDLQRQYLDDSNKSVIEMTTESNPMQKTASGDDFMGTESSDSIFQGEM